MAGVRMLAVAVATVLLLVSCNAGRPDATVADTAAVRALAIPALAESTVEADGTRRFALTAQTGTTDFGDGRLAQTIGLNQGYLGPTLRMTRGERVAVDVTNALDEMTTLHWHGMHVPAEHDGGPHSMIQPGEVWRPTWTIDQPAATLWYHSHPHGQTAQQVYRGLAGMLLIDDPANAPAGLPQQYGVDDLPVVVQDKSFADDGELIVDPEGSATTGFLGDTLVVNGTVSPYFEASTETVRLRLLNASNARVYNFGFSDGRDFDVIASDGGYLTAPHRTDRVQLSPAERAEVVVTLTPGETVSLVSYPPDLGSIVGPNHRFGTGEFRVLELRAAATLTAGAAVPAALATIDPLSPAEATSRSFRITGRAINGRPMDMGRIDEVVTVDTTEIWEVTNADPQPHNFHVHNVQMQVLDVGGDTPPPELRGWKDTVYVPPRTSVRLIMRLEDYTDPQWPYMYHCHLLWHEDIGIMGQFVVVEPGEQAGTPPASDPAA